MIRAARHRGLARRTTPAVALLAKHGTIDATRGDALMWAGKAKAALEHLPAHELRDMLRASTEKSVLVVTDDTIAVEKLIDVVDQCRLSGAKDVAVATKKEVG